MTSSFSWLDFDESSRQRMREVVEMLRESGSLDELGLGRIRDTFSDRLFPGTSQQWRRARYLLFVPWIYQTLEREGFRQSDAERAARRLQQNVRNALLQTGDTTGLIGMRTPDPVAPPDVILWPALRTWGVRESEDGTLAQYRAGLRRRPVSRGDDEGESASERDQTWNPRLPPAPNGFPSTVTLALTREEAAFLRDLVLAEDATRPADADSSTSAQRNAWRRSDSMLADLLRADELDAVAAPWQHTLTAKASAGLRDAVAHAGCFSDVMHGATLLYARCLAEQRKDEDRRDAADTALADWTADVEDNRSRLTDWATNLDAFFAVVGQGLKLRGTERTFVTQWTRIALDNPAGLATSHDARVLVEDREAHSKGGKARLTAPPDKDRGDGGVIPGPLTYRWGNARQLALDIRTGLEA